MARARFLFLAALIACSSTATPPPPEVPLGFRPIHEGVNATPCVDGPDFAVAVDEDGWIDVYDRQTACRRGDVELPAVNFTRVFVAVAWWPPLGCDDVETTEVVLAGDEVVVRARRIAREPGRCPPDLHVESILRVDRPAGTDAVARARFELDGVEAGSIPVAAP